MKEIDEPDNNAPNTPKLDEDGLLTWAVVAAVLTLIGSGFAFFWAIVQTGGNGAEMVNRARAISPFMVGGAAIVTFLSVLWRGAINSRQTSEQKRQNDSREEVELGLLLEKASDRLNATESDHRLLGFVMIETIALARNGIYAIAALELLRDHWIAWHKEENDKTQILIQRAQRLFAKAAGQGRICPPVDLSFNWRIEKSEPIGHEEYDPYRFFWDPERSEQKQRLRFEKWIPVRNLEKVQIQVMPSAVSLLNEFEGKFNCCWFWDVPKIDMSPMAEKLNITNKHSDCSFHNLSIGYIGNAGGWTAFYECDFSDAVLENPFIYSSVCSYEDCRFYHGTPPLIRGLKPSRASAFLSQFRTYQSVKELFADFDSEKSS